MLQHETPYPHVGSYAVFIDAELPPERQRPELARIQWRREGELVISLPLRDGAAGTKSIDPAQLIDASPLSAAQRREFHDLDRDLAGIEARIRRWAEQDEPGRKPRLSPRQREMAARRDALKHRIIYGPILDRLLRLARDREQELAA